MKRALVAWLLLACMVAVCLCPVAIAEETAEPTATEQPNDNAAPFDNCAVYDDVLPKEMQTAFCLETFTFDAPEAANLQSVMLLNADSGDILYQNKADVTYALEGSISMLMTTKLALNYLDPDAVIHLDSTKLNMTLTDATGIVYGADVRVVQLIAAMLLCESQQAATVLTNLLGVEINPQATPKDAVVAAMNEEALRLNMTDTVYTNPYGLRESGQKTTAADTVRLLYSLYKDDTYASLIGNTDYLIGCLYQGNFTFALDANDPRNKESSLYDANVFGYAFHKGSGQTFLALTEHVNWMRSTINLERKYSGAVIGVAVAADVSAAVDLCALMKRTPSFFGMVGCNKMLDMVLDEMSCPYCNGSGGVHKNYCKLPALEITVLRGDEYDVSAAEERFYKAVDLTALTRLITLDSSSASAITYRYEEELFTDRTYAVGDPFTMLEIYFGDTLFLMVPTYVQKAKAQQTTPVSATDDAVLDDSPKTFGEWLASIQWQTWVIFGIGIPFIIIMIYLPINAYRKMRKM